MMHKEAQVAVHIIIHDRYLKTPERKECMSNLKAELDHSKREINRVKAKIKNIQENEGVRIDEKLEQDLQS